LTLHILIHV